MNDDSDSATTSTTEQGEQEGQPDICKLRQENAQLKEQLRLRDENNAHLKELVRKALANKDYIDWEKDTSQEMKQDVALTQAAIEGGQVRWDAIPEPCRSNPDVILTALTLGQIQWRDVPEDLKQTHKEIAMYGVRSHNINADDCPCLLDRPYMKEQFLKRRIWWTWLPTSMQTSIDFARSIKGFIHLTSVVQLFQCFPQLRQERDMWIKVVEIENLGREDSVGHTVLQFAPDAIKSDRELMVNLCSGAAQGLDHIDEHLAPGP